MSRTRFVFSALVLVLLACAAVPPAQEIGSCMRTPRMFGEKGDAILDAVVSAYSSIYDPLIKRTRTMQGTGVVVGSHEVLLAAHEVLNASSMRITSRDGRMVMGHVEWIDTKVDLALVQTDEALPPPLPLRLTPAKVHEEVYLVSYLEHVKTLKVCPGEVIKAKTGVDANGAYLVETSTYSESGSSGGALVDASGNLIAIHVQGTVDRMFPYITPDIPGGKFSRPVSFFCDQYRCQDLQPR